MLATSKLGLVLNVPKGISKKQLDIPNLKLTVSEKFASFYLYDVILTE